MWRSKSEIQQTGYTIFKFFLPGVSVTKCLPVEPRRWGAQRCHLRQRGRADIDDYRCRFFLALAFAYSVVPLIATIVPQATPLVTPAVVMRIGLLAVVINVVTAWTR